MALTYNYLQWSKLSIRHWKSQDINLIRRHIWLALQQAKLMKDNGSRRPRLSRKDNQHLFKLLDIFCFFNYHQTNKGYTCYVSQIMLFISGNKSKCGWFDYIKGNFCLLNEKEVHHKDNDVTNNNCQNLQYVTPNENKILNNVIIKCKQNMLSGLNYIFQLNNHLQRLALSTLKANVSKFALLI